MKKLIIENIEDRIQQKVYQLISSFKERKDIVINNRYEVHNLSWDIIKLRIEKFDGRRRVLNLNVKIKTGGILDNKNRESENPYFFYHFNEVFLSDVFKKILNKLKYFGIDTVILTIDSIDSRTIYFNFN